MEAKIKSGTFLAESCGRASDPPQTAPTTQKYHFFYAAPNWRFFPIPHICLFDLHLQVSLNTLLC